MKAVIARGFPLRIYEIDEYGQPWVEIRLKCPEGYEQHTWCVMEKTGWRKVMTRG